VKNDLLIAFLRLRIDISDIAKVRELHVYGQMVPLNDEAPAFGYQHRGFGRELLRKAEELALINGKHKIQVTSGVGARNYYRKAGYSPDGYYMSKKVV
jgi:elongator complex protein 3